MRRPGTGNAVVTLLLSLALFASAPPVRAAAPEVKFPVTFTTTLAPNATYPFTFTLWDARTGGTQLPGWVEGPVKLRVASNKTVYFVLGSKAPLPALDYTQQYWVEIATGLKKYRTRLPAAGYSFWSESVNTDPLDVRYVEAGEAGAVTGGMIADGQVTAAKVSSESASAGTVLTSNGDGTTAWQAAPGNLDATYVNEGQANAVATAMIQNGAVTDGKITGPIAGSKLGSHQHAGGDVASGTLAEARIDGAIARDGEIVPAVLAADGAGSTLDADLLDGQHASAFASSATVWSLGGNFGTTPGTDYIGTIDDKAFEVKVNGARVMRYEPNAFSPSLVGGTAGNAATSGSFGAFVGGGGTAYVACGFLGDQPCVNLVTDNFGTVGGGYGNRAGDGTGNQYGGTTATVGGGRSNVAGGQDATVGGGATNEATGLAATVGGGMLNAAAEQMATVAGGVRNSASGAAASVAGGMDNSAPGAYAAVPGGSYNVAGGANSLAAGHNAKVRTAAEVGGGDVDGDQGTFIWADSAAWLFTSTGPDQFLIRATGGVGINKNNPASALDVAGTVTATAFAGDGSALTGISAGPHAHDAAYVNEGQVAAVSAAMIQDGAVTDAKITGPITGSKLGSHQHAGADVASGTVAEARIDALVARDSEIVPAVLAADGAGSTLDADLLDGSHAAAFAAAAHVHDASYWGLGGNAGTAPGTHFIGTTDNQALEVKVNGTRVLRLEPTATDPNVIMGSVANTLTAGVRGAVVAGGSGNTACGSDGYQICANAVTDHFGTIAGGMGNQAGNASGDAGDAYAATVGGGRENQASNMFATVAGGTRNVATHMGATVGGGHSNSATGWDSVAAGGYANTASGDLSTVAGGNANTASGQFSTVVGGTVNTAGGDFSLAAGHLAIVRDAATVGGGDTTGDEGTFVWADSTSEFFQSTGPNQFLIRANGGVGINKNSPATALDVNGTVTASGFSAPAGDLSFGPTPRQMLTLGSPEYGIGVQPGFLTYLRTAGAFVVYRGGVHDDAGGPGPGGAMLMAVDPSGLIVNGTFVSTSDRNVKQGFAPVDAAAVLAKVAALPIESWTYRSDERGSRHLGPMAQDFRAAFGLGLDDKTISTVDADGVALAAIQGLNKAVEEQRARIDAQADELAALKAQLVAQGLLIERLLASAGKGGTSTAAAR